MKYAMNGPLHGHEITGISGELRAYGEEIGRYRETQYAWVWTGPELQHPYVGYATTGPRAGYVFGHKYPFLTVALKKHRYGCYVLKEAVWEWSGPLPSDGVLEEEDER